VQANLIIDFCSRWSKPVFYSWQKWRHERLHCWFYTKKAIVHLERSKNISLSFNLFNDEVTFTQAVHRQRTVTVQYSK